MTESLSRTGRRIGSLSPHLQTEFFLAFASNLTIAARGHYDPSEADVHAIGALKGINEIVHQILGRVHAAGSGSAGYPIETLFDLIDEEAEGSGTQAEVEWAAERACEAILEGRAAQAS